MAAAARVERVGLADGGGGGGDRKVGGVEAARLHGGGARPGRLIAKVELQLAPVLDRRSGTLKGVQRRRRRQQVVEQTSRRRRLFRQPNVVFVRRVAATGAVALGPSAGADASTLVPLRAFAAGVFVYMSLFELAPPHAHGRLESLRFLCAFAVGMSLVFLSEAAESWAVGSFFDAEVSGVTVSNASSLLANNISRLVVTEEDVGVDRLVPLEASAPMAHAQAHAGE